MPITPYMRRFAGQFAPAYRRDTNREVSAYLSELTSPRVNPHLALIHVGRFAMLSDRGQLALVGRIMLAAMTDEAIIDEERKPNHASIVNAFAELSSLSADELRARAHQTYEKLYGHELPTIKSLD